MRLIIDTDTAGDDVFSLMLALTRPGVIVEAITIAHGNVGFVQHSENALTTLEVCGKAGEVPVYLGAQKPFSRAPLDAAYVFGADGMSDSAFPLTVQRPSEGHAVDEIVRRVMAEPGQITLIAQAPLTNIALAYLREPRIAEAVKHAAKRIPIIAGTGANSTKEAIELASFSKKAGADASLTVVPYYNKPTQEGLYLHFILAFSLNRYNPKVFFNLIRLAHGIDIKILRRIFK